MLDVKQPASSKAKESIRALKLGRETLRELGEPMQGQGVRHTSLCDTERRCTRGCGPFTKKLC